MEVPVLDQKSCRPMQAVHCGSRSVVGDDNENKHVSRRKKSLGWKESLFRVFWQGPGLEG